MSKTIDEKVVEMRFDNRNFEKNVQVSLNTLDKLKQKTDMSKHTKSFDALGKAANRVSFDKMGQSIDTVKVKLSAMQVVGATVISRLTNEVMNFARKVENVVKDSLIGGGIRRAQNIENAHFMLQGLLKDEEKVQAVMADAMDSVDGTAYAYDEAAKAASQFAASGLQAGEEMQRALRGITGVAAMTNSEYESISQIFTTVAGNGRVMSEQLLQLSSRGMNAAATLAEHFGKTEQEIRKMVTDGEVSFEMFAEAMDSAFGEHAKKANETFNGAMSNVKSALSRIGAKFVSPLIVQNGKLVESLNLIRMRINDINKKVDPIANAFVKTVERILSLFDRVTNNSLAFNFTLVGIMNIIKNVGKVAKALGQAFMEMFPFKSQRETIKMAENFSKITKSMILTDEKVDKLKRTFKGVIAIFDTFNYVVGSIIKFGLKELSELLGINNGTFLDTTANIGDMLVAFRDWVKEGDRVTVALTKITNGIKKVVTWISNLRKSAKGASGGGGGAGQMTSTLTRIGNVFKHIFSGIKEYVTGGIDVLKKFIEAHKELDENFTLGDMLRDFKDQVLSYFFDIEGAIDKLIEAFGKLRDKGKNSVGNIELPFKKMFETFKTKITELKNKYLPNLDFGSVFAVAFSTGVIVLLRKFGRAVQSLQKFLGQIASPLKAVNKVLNTFAGTLAAYTNKLKAESILIMATAIGVLALSLKILADVPWTSLAKGIISIGALGVILVGFSAAIGTINVALSFTAIGKLGLVLASFAGALLILAKALDAISEVSDVYTSIGQITQLGIILSSFIVVMGAVSKLIMRGGSIGQVGIAMIGFAVGLKVLISALKDVEDLKGIKFTNEQALMVVSAMAGFAMILAASKEVNWKAAIGVVAMAAGVKLIVSALTEIQNVDLSDKANELVILGGIITAMVIIGKYAGKNMQQAGIGIAAMAAGMYIIVKTFNLIKNLKSAEINKALKAFAGIFIALVPVIVASKVAGAEAHKAGLMILEISGAMLMMVASIALLGNMKKEKLWQGVAAISILELAFGGLIALSKVGTASAETFKGIIALTATVAVITGCIAALSMVDQDRVKTAAIALGGIMLVFGILEDVSTAVSNNLMSWKNLAVVIAGMVVVISSISLVLIGLSNLSDPTANLKNATALSELLIVLTGCLVVLNNVKAVDFGGIAQACLAMVEIFGIVVGGIALVLELIGSIAELFEVLAGEDVVTYIDKGIEIVGKVGEALGTFFGSIVSGFATAASSGLPDIGTNLSQFWTNAQPFFDGIKSVDESTANAAKNLAIALGALLVEGEFERFSNSGFMKLLNSWSTFSFGEKGSGLSGIEELGNAIKKFAEVTADIDESTAKKIEAASKAAAALFKMAGDVPRSGGKIEELIGNNDMDKFGKALTSFGTALVSYGNSVEGLKTEAIETSRSAAEKLIEIADMIPNAGGAIAFLAGDNDIGTFGIHIEQFGRSLVNYSDAVTGLKVGAIDLSKDAAEKLIEVAELIPENSGVFQFFTGEMNMEGFGNQLSSFGESIVKYSESVAKADFGSISKSVGPVKDILSIAAFVGNKKDFKSMKSFGKQLVDFADKLKDYDKKVNKLNTDKMVSSAKVIQKLSNIFSTMSDIDTKAVKSFDKALKNVSITGLTNFIKDFSKTSKKFNKCGEEIMNNIAKGINAKKDVIKKGLEDPINSALSAIRSHYTSFSTTGGYLVQGLVNGILSKLQTAYQAGHKLGTTVDQGTKDAVEVNSPSKKAYKVGEFYVTGLCNALGAGKSKAKKVAGELGDAVNEGLSKMINGATSVASFMPGNKAQAHIKSMISSMQYGMGALQQFVNRYVKGAASTIVGVSATKQMAAAITAYGKELYAKSSYAEQDAANLASHQATLTKLENEKVKLEKDIKKNSKKTDKESKSKVKSLKNDLKSVKNEITSAKNQIIQDQNDVAAHTVQVYNDLKNKLADSAQAFMNPLAQSLETGISLFTKYEDNLTLLAEDKKNLETYQAEYDELLKKREEIQNEITKMEKINTTASRLNGKNLEKELSEIDKLIEKQKSKIESVEESIEEHSALTTTSILDNMRSQVENVTRYQNNLNKLINEGKVSNGLIEELKQQGIEGADYVDQFTKMTDKEIEEANRLYEESKKLSANTLTSNFEAAMNKATAWGEAMLTLQERGFNKQLLENLGDLGVDGSQYIDAFMTMTPEQIQAFNDKYTQYLSIPDSVSDTIMLSFAKAGNESIAKYIEALNAINDPGSASAESLKTVGEVTGQSIMDIMTSKASVAGQFMVQELSDSVSSKKSLKKAKKAGKQTSKAVVDGAESEMKSDKTQEKIKKTVGKYFGNTATTEINKLKPGLKEAAKKLMKQGIIAGAMEGLEEHSPSKAAIRIVKYFGQGLTVGFDKIEGDVESSAKSSAETIVSTVAEALDADMDTTPTITPVIDLSQIQNGTDNLNNMLNGVNGTVSINNDLANSIRTIQNDNSALWGAVNDLRDTIKQMDNNSGNTIFNNDFKIENPDPKAVATEVSNILQRQVDRRSREWA